MKPQLPTSLHLLGRHIEGLWVVSCLEFDLADQDYTYEAAEQRVIAQAYDFVQDVLELDSPSDTERLLNRRAPLRLWALFWLAKRAQGLRALLGASSMELPFQQQPV